jgi:hypothetical protein
MPFLIDKFEKYEVDIKDGEWKQCITIPKEVSIQIFNHYFPEDGTILFTKPVYPAIYEFITYLDHKYKYKVDERGFLVFEYISTAYNYGDLDKIPELIKNNTPVTFEDLNCSIDVFTDKSIYIDWDSNNKCFNLQLNKRGNMRVMGGCSVDTIACFGKLYIKSLTGKMPINYITNSKTSTVIFEDNTCIVYEEK